VAPRLLSLFLEVGAKQRFGDDRFHPLWEGIKADRPNHRGQRASHYERTWLVDQCEPFNARSIAPPAHFR
jgi:hypothetical protein